MASQAPQDHRLDLPIFGKNGQDRWKTTDAFGYLGKRLAHGARPEAMKVGNGPLELRPSAGWDIDHVKPQGEAQTA